MVSSKRREPQKQTNNKNFVQNRVGGSVIFEPEPKARQIFSHRLSALMLVCFILIEPKQVMATEFEFPVLASSDSCSAYRQGAVIGEKIAIYSKPPSIDQHAFKFIKVVFRPEYLESDFSPPREDGLPQRDLLFELDIDSGQPVPYELRSKESPITDNTFRILLSGLPYLALKRTLPIYGGAKIAQSDYINGPYEHLIRRTGELEAGFERVEVRRPQVRKWNDDVFIDAKVGSPLLGVLTCKKAGSVRNPSCELFEETSLFEIKVGGFRRNQLKKIEKIRTHARLFTACLTWDGGMDGKFNTDRN